MRAPKSSRPATRVALRSGFVAGMLLGAMGFGAVPPAVGEELRIQSTTYRPPHRRAAEPARDHRRLISPMGSAAGVAPGYYNRNLGWHGPPLEVAPIYPGWPSVVYVGQPLFPPEPPPVTVINNVTVNSPPPMVERVLVREEPPARPAARRDAEPEAPQAPRPTAPQPVFFQIMPADAQVKLDGRKLGSGAELGSRQEPVELDPGVYILQVDHPVYKSQRLVFGVSAERVRVDVDLTAEDASLRARVR